jgi:hypothetical protein
MEVSFDRCRWVFVWHFSSKDLLRKVFPDFGGATALQSQWSQGHWHGHHGGPRPGTGNRQSTSVFVKSPKSRGLSLPVPSFSFWTCHHGIWQKQVRSFPRASHTRHGECLGAGARSDFHPSRRLTVGGSRGKPVGRGGCAPLYYWTLVIIIYYDSMTCIPTVIVHYLLCTWVSYIGHN